jgi:hypothetical protein
MTASAVPLNQEVLFLFATDVGPQNNLKKLIEPATKAGYYVFFPSIDECTEATTERLLGQFLPRRIIAVTGLSSFKSAVEIKIGKTITGLARRGGAAEWWIQADTHFSWGRPAAQGRINSAHLLIAVESETDLARNFGYERIYYAGGPPMWQDFWLTSPVSLVANPRRGVFYYSGIKMPNLTDAMIEVGVRGANLIFGHACDHIIRMHPAEDGKPREMRPQEWTNLRITKLNETILKDVSVLEVDPTFTSAQLAISANYPFSTCGGTDGIIAAMHRKRAFYYEDDAVRERNIAQIGRGEWYPAERGALMKIRTPEDIARVFGGTDPKYLLELKAAQEMIYPRPDPEKLAVPVADQILDCIAHPTHYEI